MTVMNANVQPSAFFPLGPLTLYLIETELPQSEEVAIKFTSVLFQYLVFQEESY